MSAQEDYAEAQSKIAEARKNGGTKLELGGLEHLERFPPEITALTDLKELFAWGTSAADLTPLQGLAGLQHLDLDNTQISDLTPLQGLAGLRTLTLGNTQISDLTPLQGLAGLQTLTLTNTQISDLTPLQGLAGLRTLTLTDTQIWDLTPLQGLTDLQSLYLINTQISDLTPLQELAGLQTLTLTNTQISDLTPLQGLAGLQSLRLDNTQISDLIPLRKLDALQRLDLRYTQISDLIPLRKLDALQRLDLRYTQISDLRPIRDLSFDPSGSSFAYGLRYQNTPATRADATLAQLAEIENHEERTQKTLAYLRSLPEPPAPLPWDISNIDPNDTPPNPPEPDAVPRVSWVGDQIDLDHSPLSEADQIDPIKRRMFERLRDTLDDLKRIGNLYPELDGPARRLLQACADGFDEADLLDIHLEIAALTDITTSNDTRPQAERIAPEDLDIVRRTTRLGPPLTLGHPDVDLFEARNAEYAQRRPPATVPHSERLVAGALARDTPMTARARETAERVAEVPDQGRLAAFRSSFVKNALLQGVGFYFAGLVGQVGQTHTIQLAEFLIANKDAILTVALSWGEQGHIWAADLIARSQEMLRLWRDRTPGK